MNGDLKCLNSTMVRLKLELLMQRYNWFTSLNSTMVRLKRISLLILVLTTLSLNSTMVRLKHFSFYRRHVNKTCLNSTMVRLKHSKERYMKQRYNWSQFHYGSIKTYFNLEITAVGKTSQFHYGSIKTIIRIDSENKYSPVSIPLWFD